MDSDLEISFESDGEDITAGDILKSMEEIWINEKFAPEILPNKMELVDCLYLQIQEMEKNVARLDNTDVRKCLHELELIRIRYLLSSYLRTRLLKLENYAQDILAQEEVRRNAGAELYLTESETVFTNAYKILMDNYTKDLFKFMPGFVPEESKENPIKPNLQSFVFFQSKKPIGSIFIHDETVDVENNSKIIMSYNSVSSLLKDGDVRLI